MSAQDKLDRVRALMKMTADSRNKPWPLSASDVAFFALRIIDEDVGYLGEVISYPPPGLRSDFQHSDPCDEQLPSYSKERKGE